MPYNKGDFTQQGVNGDVSALVRLNEKRVMKVVLSSDDESDNCDISGKVYDLLNGTSYDIGSGGGGGGGTELRKCTVTIVNNTEIPAAPAGLGLNFYTLIDNMICVNTPRTLADIIPVGDSKKYEALYQFYYVDPEAYPLVKDVTGIGVVDPGLTISVTNKVNCEELEEDGELLAINPIDPTQDSSVTVTFAE